MHIARRHNSQVLTDKIDFFEGWQADYPEPAHKTVNHVTYLQRRGRMEWLGEITLVFADIYATAPINNMYTFVRAARMGEWFNFVDRSGATHVVKIKTVPIKERDESRTVEYYYLDCVMLLFGANGTSYE